MFKPLTRLLAASALGLALLNAAGAHDGERDRDHDQRRRGVGDEHAEQRGSRHEGEEQARCRRRSAFEQGEREPPVQSDALDREREEGAAEDQEQDRRIIFLGDRIGVHHAEGGHGEEGEERGDGERQRLGHPPDRHQHGQRRDAPGGEFHSGGGREQKHDAEDDEPADQSQPARARHRPLILPPVRSPTIGGHRCFLPYGTRGDS